MDEVKNETKSNKRKVIKISKKKFVVAIILIMVLVIWVGYKMMSNKIGIGNDIYMSNDSSESIIPTASLMGGNEYEKSIAPDYYYRGYGEPSIGDTREFMKTSYFATIQTRDVSDMVRDVKNAVKGADGRVDNLNSSEKSGRINFVVAKSKFDDFKSEIESLTHKKLYTENISSENLLSQKQGIEEQTNNITSTLDNLKSQKTSLNTKHSQTINSINKELADIKAELINVRTNISITTDSSIMTALRSQETSLVQQETLQNQKLNSENSNYSIQSKNLENQITSENNNLINVKKEDVKFADNIETVSGSIYVNWISLWEVAEIFSPIPLFFIIVIIIAIIYICYRKRIPKVILE